MKVLLAPARDLLLLLVQLPLPRAAEWVRQETREGRLPAIQLGRYWRYRRERVLTWLEEREETSRKHKPKVTA